MAKTTSGTIKINMLQTQILQLVAAVARDDRGEILKAWAKKQEYCDAIEAEAAAFTGALKLASLGGYQKIMIESDSKLCIDELMVTVRIVARTLEPYLKMYYILGVFLSFSFSCVKRELNYVAHALGKPVSPLNPSLCCNISSSSLPHLF